MRTGGTDMRLKKKLSCLTAAALALSMVTATMAPSSAAGADGDEVSYKYKDAYTYGWNNSVVAYENGALKNGADIKAYSKQTDDPFTPEESEKQAWDVKALELTPGVAYTTEDGEAHPITSMLTNWNFCADPTSIDNSGEGGDGKLYVYGTTEAVEYSSSDSEMIQNGYHNHSLTIMSTKDMVNWTDEGFMDTQNLTNEPEDSGDKVKRGWGTQAWAPSGIRYDGDGDGEMEYYLFHTNGGAVGYVRGDSPTGPWYDDLGTTLFSQGSPNCKDVVWCFDPAALVDDQGNAYVYFGGGIPGGNNATDLQKSHPKTGRVCKIKFEPDTGKVLMDGEPQEMDTYYLFEDSEINQFHGKYFYSYCTNFQVNGSKQPLGALNPIASGQIACYVSTDPMDIAFNPEEQESTDDWKYLGTILANPSSIYGKSYNNHHRMLSYKGHDYIIYHSTALENMLYHTTNDYRCLHVDEIEVDEDTDDIKIEPTYEGPEQIENFDPYDGKINATTTSYSAGVKSAKSDEAEAMVLDKIDTGDWTKISGVDFGEGAAKITARVASATEHGAIEVFLDDPTSAGNKVGTLALKNTGEEVYDTIEANLTGVSGVHDVYFVFRGTDYRVASWEFTKATAPAPEPEASAQPGTPSQPEASAQPGTPSQPNTSVQPEASVQPAPTVTTAPNEGGKVTLAKPAIRSVKNVKGKKAQVTLKKKIKDAAGYEIQYSLKSNMKSAKKIQIKKASTLKATIKGLKNKKTYYVRARAYVTVDGKKQYSAWSAKKKVKIKK